MNTRIMDINNNALNTSCKEFVNSSKMVVDSEPNYHKKIELIRSNILGYCRKVIFDWSEAEDVCQNVLYILADKQSEYDCEKSFFSWAFNICRFQIKGYIKKEKRSRLVLAGFDEGKDSFSTCHDSMQGDCFIKKDWLMDDEINESGRLMSPSGSPNDSPECISVKRQYNRGNSISLGVRGHNTINSIQLNNVIPKEFLNLDNSQLLRLLSLNLTSREKEIFKLLKEGYSNKEIGEKLNLKASAMNTAKTRLINKLQDRLKFIQNNNKYDYQKF